MNSVLLMYVGLARIRLRVETKVAFKSKLAIIVFQEKYEC